VTVRTLWNVRQEAVSVCAARKPGRPSHVSQVTWSTIRTVARAWKKQGHSSGEGAVFQSLERRVPLRLVRTLLARLKQRLRRVTDRLRRHGRTSLSARGRDVMWALDATHLGRDCGGQVQGEVLRDCASTRILAVSVGRPSSTGAVLDLLATAIRRRGAPPLVISTDNGPVYRSTELAQWLSHKGVVHLFSEPRTPQHNAFAERAIGELKQETGLGKGSVLEPLGSVRSTILGMREKERESSPDWCRRLIDTVHRLNEARVRKSRGYKTACQLDAALPRGEDLACRESFLRAVSRNVELAVQSAQGARARRQARREAILCTLESFGLATRTRGGRPWTATKAESGS
jgi:transposase InsO family protein